MAQQHDRSGVIKFCRQVIRANPNLTDEEIDQQLDSVWKSGYLAGRKVIIRESLVAKGVQVVRKIRQESVMSIYRDSNRKESAS